MKLKFLLFLIFLIFSNNLQATEKIWSRESEPIGRDPNWFQGPCTFMYKNGKVESEGEYDSNKKEGIWKYWFENGQERREAKFSEGKMIGSVSLWAIDGHKVVLNDFAEKVKSFLPTNSSPNQIIADLADLNQDGQYEIVVDARDEKDLGLDRQSMLMILDEKGSLLTEKAIADCGNDDLFIGSLGKGKPSCFGELLFCAGSAGVCEWRYFVWIHGQIKEVLKMNGAYGKSGPFFLPKFEDVDHDGTNELVGDDGVFKWDDKHETFTSVNGYLYDFSKSDGYKWLSDDEKKKKKIKSSNDHLLAGKKLARNHQYAFAITQYFLATQDNDLNYEAWELLGYTHILNHSPGDQCRLALKKSVSIKPDYIMGHYNLALAYWATGLQEDCFNEIKKVIELDPSYEKIIHSDMQFKKIFKSDAYTEWKKSKRNSSKDIHD